MVTIGGGKAQETANPGNFAQALYEGFFVDSADACVDMTATDVKDPTMIQGGIVFGATDTSNFYVFMLRADGQADLAASEQRMAEPRSASPGGGREGRRHRGQHFEGYLEGHGRRRLCQ